MLDCGHDRRGLQGLGAASDLPSNAGDLATTMVLRASFGALAGAAAAPRGREGIWAAAGFVAAATTGEIGIVGVLLAALWKKADP